MNDMNLRERMSNLSVSQAVVAGLAGVHESDVSRAARGVHIASHRVDKIGKAIAELEKLFAASVVRPDLSTPANAARALEHAGIRAAAQDARPPVQAAASSAVRSLYQPDLLKIFQQ